VENSEIDSRKKFSNRKKLPAATGFGDFFVKNSFKIKFAAEISHVSMRNFSESRRKKMSIRLFASIDIF
jgi:hypothetical protein